MKGCLLCPRLQETNHLLGLHISKPVGDRNWFDCNSSNMLFAVMSNYGTPEMRYNILYSRGPLRRTVHNLPEEVVNIGPDWCILPFLEFQKSAYDVCESDVTNEKVKSSNMIAEQIAEMEAVRQSSLAEEEEKEKEKEKATMEVDTQSPKKSKTPKTPKTATKDAKEDQQKEKKKKKKKKPSKVSVKKQS